MIKKLKLGLLVIVLSLAISASSANAAALTWTANQSISLTGSGYTLTIQSGSEATSAVIGTTTLQVVIPTSSVFTLTSHQNLDLTLNSGTATTSNTCSGTTNTLAITSTGTANYTITPNGGVCAASSGGGGTTPSGGGAPYVPYVAPATVANKVIQGCNGTAGFSTVTGESCQFNTGGVTLSGGTPNAGAATTSASTATYKVSALGTVTLKNGSKGEAVKELQRVLNKILKTTLVVDGKLGPKTIATIKTWQRDHHLVADGLVGKLTKAAMVAEANK